MKIKICGIRSKEDIQLMNYFKPDFIGFIFFPKSPRYLTFVQALKLKSKLDPKKHLRDLKKILECFNRNIIDYVQLHGKESQEQIQKLKDHNIPVIKAIKMESKNDLMEIDKYNPDYFLFDIKDDVRVGGTGKSFNWEYLNSYSKEIPYFLAGGINSKNISKALKTSASVLDISSGVETNYKKDKNKTTKLFDLYNLENGKL